MMVMSQADYPRSNLDCSNLAVLVTADAETTPACLTACATPELDELLLYGSLPVNF